MLYSLGLLLSLVQVSLSCEGDYVDMFDHYTYMDEGENFRLFWTNINDSHIEFGLAVQATGWIAIGISPNGQMPDSDIALAWVDDTDGRVYLEDRYAYDRVVPELDEEQNLLLIGGSQEDGMTCVQFIREKYFCDREDDRPVSDGTTRVIYAYNPDDLDPDAEDVDGTIVWHDQTKGTKSINLVSGDTTVVELPEDAMYVDLLAANYTIPADDTTYYCILLKLPEFDNVHHIVAFEPLVQEGHEGIVHHFLLDRCNADLVDEANLGFDAECDVFSSMNFDEATCTGQGDVAAWAVGGNGFYFPENVGLAMSGVADGLSPDILQYVVLSIHYDNPEELSGIVDHSGFRVWYTPTLREEEAGLLSLGIAVGDEHFIPAGLETTNFGYCNSGCTQNGLPSGGVNIFASMLHAHNIGSSLKARHVRDGVELPPIDSNNNYDFNYQQWVALEDEVHVERGDEFILECGYDSTDRDEVTYGGQSSLEEMCLVYLYMYPKQDMTECLSFHSDDQLDEWLEGAVDKGYIDTSNYNYLTEEDGAEEYYNELWYDEKYAERNMYCGNYLDELIYYRSEDDMPVIEEEYVSDADCKDDDDSASFHAVLMPLLLPLALFFA